MTVRVLGFCLGVSMKYFNAELFVYDSKNGNAYHITSQNSYFKNWLEVKKWYREARFRFRFMRGTEEVLLAMKEKGTKDKPFKKVVVKGLNLHDDPRRTKRRRRKAS